MWSGGEVRVRGGGVRGPPPPYRIRDAPVARRLEDRDTIDVTDGGGTDRVKVLCGWLKAILRRDVLDTHQDRLPHLGTKHLAVGFPADQQRVISVTLHERPI